MAVMPRFYTRLIGLSLFIATGSLMFLFTQMPNAQYPFYVEETSSQHPFSNFGSKSAEDAHGKALTRLNLTDEQCKEAFPEWTTDIDNNVKKGRFIFEKSNPDYKGLVEGKISDGQLYILATGRAHSPVILYQRAAILSQIHRALLTSPSPLPDTYFAFVINDNPKNNSWVFARPNKETKDNMWLMPHFAFWAWPGHGLGAMDDILRRIDNLETSTPWENKIDKVVWRGTSYFNPIGRPTLRGDLVKAAKGKDWADVEALQRDNKGQPTNALPIEDFCKYRYIAHTEGVTYSGRLPYHQACGSVVLMAPLTYLTHTAMLLKPILAADLVAGFEDEWEKGDGGFGEGRSMIRPILPTVKDWKEANAIYLDPGFKNLESTVLFLQRHPEVAQKIAQNQRDMAVRKGYLDSGAEVCYWRALIRGWASVARPHDDWGDLEGQRYEEWILGQVQKASSPPGRQ